MTSLGLLWTESQIINLNIKFKHSGTFKSLIWHCFCLCHQVKQQNVWTGSYGLQLNWAKVIIGSSFMITSEWLKNYDKWAKVTAQIKLCIMLQNVHTYRRIFGCDSELRSWISWRKLFRFDGWLLLLRTITSPVTTWTAYNTGSKLSHYYECIKC